MLKEMLKILRWSHRNRNRFLVGGKYEKGKPRPLKVILHNNLMVGDIVRQVRSLNEHKEYKQTKFRIYLSKEYREFPKQKLDEAKAKGSSRTEDEQSFPAQSSGAGHSNSEWRL